MKPDLSVTLTETNAVAVWTDGPYPTLELTEAEASALAEGILFALDELRNRRGWGR